MTDNLSLKKDLYLELIKKTLTGYIYDESAWYIFGTIGSEVPLNFSKPIDLAKNFVKKAMVKIIWLTGKLMSNQGYLVVKPNSFDSEKNKNSVGNWSFLSYSMISRDALDNIQECIEKVIDNNVPGDLIETGVWRGGSTIFMRAVLKCYDVTDRTVWVADSFEGLPTSDGSQYDADKVVKVEAMNSGGLLDIGLAVPIEKVQANFAKFDLLDGQVKFLKGWFKDTLPRAPIEKISLLRLDGDMYESTMDALNALYKKVSPGGYVIVDDYNAWPHAKQAIDDFRSKHHIQAELIPVDRHVVYWQVPQR